MPIGIPHMQRRTIVSNNFEAADEEFVPPHLIEQQVSRAARQLPLLGGGTLRKAVHEVKSEACTCCSRPPA
jgi:hypothetical protein